MVNRNITILMIIILILIIITLISIMVISIVERNSNYKVKFFAFGNKTKILFQNQYDIENIKNIDIISKSDNVKLIEGTSDNVKVTIYGIDGEDCKV